MPEELRASLVVEYIVVQTGVRSWKLARSSASVWGTTFELLPRRFASEEAAHAERKRRATRAAAAGVPEQGRKG